MLTYFTRILYSDRTNKVTVTKQTRRVAGRYKHVASVIQKDSAYCYKIYTILREVLYIYRPIYTVGVWLKAEGYIKVMHGENLSNFLVE